MDRIAQTIEPAGTGAVFRLWGFLLASLCVHATALLLLKWNSATDGPPRNEPALSMTLSLAEPISLKPTVHPPVRRSHTRNQVQPKTRPALASTSVSSKVQREPLEPTEPTSPQQNPAADISALPAYTEISETARTEPPDRQTAGSTNDVERARQSSAQAQIETLILTDLTRRFVYPALARRRGWQGTVVLALTVKPSGILDRVRVARSSGYDLLDRSALDTIRHAERIAQARQWLGGQALELRLPVVYRLTE